ncbi:MAG: PqqD family protein [Oscillospiraceae bacterium]|nr:PqqD family protein [Oscillospiraceae bacterium]
MKIKDGFVLKVIAGSGIAVPVGDESVNCRSMIKINQTGTFLWNMLESGAEHGQLVQGLMDEYGIEQPQADTDAAEFAADLRKAGVLCE